MVFQLFVLEANQDGIENRISFFCTMFSTRMGLSKFWCTYVLYISTKTEMIAWPRVVWLKTQEHETVVWGMFGIYFFLDFSNKSDVHLYRGKKKL